MPLFETPPEAVDRVYAESLFQLAERAGGRERLESLSGELDELVELTRSMPGLSEFLSSRILGTAERAASLEKIFEGRASDLLMRFLQVLNRKERLPRLLSIVSAYHEMVQSRFGRIEVDVWTRSPLEMIQVERIRERLAKALNREPVVHAFTDEAMIGGVKMQIGDRLYDGSIRTQLRNMSELMKKEGTALMRSRADAAYEGGVD